MTMKARKNKPKYRIEEYRFTETRAYYRGKYLDRFGLVRHLNHWWPGVPWIEWAKVCYYMELKKCLQSKVNIRNNYGSNRLCNRDGMDECLSHTKEEARKERASSNE